MKFLGYIFALKTVLAFRSLECNSTLSGSIQISHPADGEYSDFSVSGCETVDLQKDESVSDSTVYDFTETSGECGAFTLNFWHKVDGVYFESFSDIVDCSDYGADDSYVLTYNIEMVQASTTTNTLENQKAPFAIYEYVDEYSSKGTGNRVSGNPVYFKIRKTVEDGKETFPPTSCSVTGPEGQVQELFNTGDEDHTKVHNSVEVFFHEEEGGFALAFQFKLFLFDIYAHDLLLSCEVSKHPEEPEDEYYDDEDMLVGSAYVPSCAADFPDFSTSVQYVSGKNRKTVFENGTGSMECIKFSVKAAFNALLYLKSSTGNTVTIMIDDLDFSAMGQRISFIRYADDHEVPRPYPHTAQYFTMGKTLGSAGFSLDWTDFTLTWSKYGGLSLKKDGSNWSMVATSEWSTKFPDITSILFGTDISPPTQWKFSHCECEAVPSSGFAQIPGITGKYIRTNSEGSYSVLASGLPSTGCFKTEIRARYDAFIKFISTNGKEAQVILGGWNNTKSVVRYTHLGNQNLVEVNEELFNRYEYRKFEVSWSAESGVLVKGEGILSEFEMAFNGQWGDVFPGVARIEVKSGQWKSADWYFNNC